MVTRTLTDFAGLIEQARHDLTSHIIGKEGNKLLLFVALIAKGHVLLEGPMGSAKTTLAKSFAMACRGNFRRIQFTPDMLPADVTGFYLYSLEGSPRFIEGPVFANFVLADEINRSTPRTQAALVEAMQEGQVTLEGKTHLLPQPFMVIASQVPTGHEGTFPLIDVQLDRFMFRLESQYPTQDEERQMLPLIDEIEDVEPAAALQLADIQSMQSEVKRIFVTPAIVDYITDIVHWLRYHSDVFTGPSPRGSIALFKGARALALLDGRDYVIPDDVKAIAEPALVHRFFLKPEAEADGVQTLELIRQALETVLVPK